MIILQILTLIISAFISVLVGYFFNRFIKFTRDSKAQNEAILDATLSTLRYSLVEAHYNYVKYGKINRYALDAAEDQYKAYHDLGGNGFIENVMKEIRALPIVN